MVLKARESIGPAGMVLIYLGKLIKDKSGEALEAFEDFVEEIG